jgi:hypothetical protein
MSMLALICGTTLRAGADFERDRRHCHLAAGLLSLGTETRPQLLECRNVSAVVLGDMWNRVPCFGQMLSGLPPDAAHGNALDLAPLREIGKVRLGKVTGAWCCQRRRASLCDYIIR